MRIWCYSFFALGVNMTLDQHAFFVPGRFQLFFELPDVILILRNNFV